MGFIKKTLNLEVPEPLKFSNAIQSFIERRILSMRRQTKVDLQKPNVLLLSDLRLLSKVFFK